MKILNKVTLKSLIPILLFSLLSTACVSSKKYKQLIDSKPKALIPENHSSDWISVNYSGLTQDENELTFKHNRIIPALFYYNWNVAFDCSLKSETRVEYVKNGIFHKAYKLKPDNKEIHIDIEDIPGEFSYKKKAFLISIIYLQFGTYKENIYPDRNDLVATYKVVENGEIVMQEKINIPIINDKLNLTNKHTYSKQFIKYYLKKYKKETEKMGGELLSEIMNQIENKQ